MFLFVLTLIGCTSALCNAQNKELNARRRRPMHKVPPATHTHRDDDAAAIAQILEEKEKDLELAAQIGKSLLESNRELQDRNDFLEESLIKSNEKTAQLQHQLKQRINLLHSISDDYDDDADLTNAARERRANLEALKRKVRHLEEDNHLLKADLVHFKNQNGALEDKEKELAEEYFRQLDSANDKISRLQSEIVMKNEECAVQSAEVEQLIKDINLRHNREKVLNEENLDLHTQLTVALEKQEQLAATVESLQERYTEVMGMLQDAEEELSNFRQRGNFYMRTTSSDSLYDSLASELEASDSGFYNTPMISARSESRQSHPSNLHSEMDKFTGGHVSGPLSLGAELAAQLSDPQFLPSETTYSPLREGEVLEVPSAVMIDIAARRSRSRSRPKSLKKEPVLEVLPEPKIEVREPLPTLVEAPTPITPIKSLAVPVATSTPVAAPRGIPQFSEEETASCSSSSSLSKSISNESLANYEGPKMGQPGQPGTRDLDYGIRRLQLKKQIELDYQQYRRQRGLAPTKPQRSSKCRLSKMVAELAKSRSLLPQWSFAQEAQEKLIANDPFARFLASTDPLRVCQPYRKLTQVGLFGVIGNGDVSGTSNGILTRRSVNEHLSAPSTPTSSPVHAPITPTRHLVYTNGVKLTPKSLPEPDHSQACPPPEDPSPQQQRPSRLLSAVSGMFTRSASVRLPKNTLALSRDNSPTSLAANSLKYEIVPRGLLL
ncbi:hypothetical protein L596_029271 [Steinernema carpocapsae]|uniref:HAP1 N-terminal domain-containing protein n=1 Tax=Steinernema carpocapsae TaxID=34508 RepID=A0A4U5LU55_STECR|nr:hypothetical protein L596_029271 [Steinernema carpocapsae]